MSREYAYCSGVLPYTDFNNNIYFLMGKSRRNGRLVTFSGKNDLLDEGIEETAAREFFEESLGSIMDKQAALAAIKKSKLRLYSKTPRNMPCYTYLVEIPYRKMYAIAFQKTKNFLTEINIRSFEYHEMCDIKWVCSRSMLDKVRKQWERTGCLADPEEWKKIETLCARPCVNSINWRQDVEPLSDSDIDEDGPPTDAHLAMIHLRHPPTIISDPINITKVSHREPTLSRSI